MCIASCLSVSRKTNESRTCNRLEFVLPGILLALGITSLAGCGGGNAPGNSNASSSQPVETQPGESGVSSAVPAGTARALPQSDPALNEPNASSPPTANGGAPSSSIGRADDQRDAPKPAEAENAKVFVVPQPSAQQLASWAVAEYEPLQLLGCRDIQDGGLITQIAAMPGGGQFISAGSQVVLWSIESDDPVHTFASGADETINSLAIAPNGKWFATAGNNGQLRQWSLTDRKEVDTKKIYDGEVVQLVISPSGQEIATIGHDNTVAIWNAQGLTEKRRFKVNTNGLKRIAYLSDELLAAAGESTSIWLVGSGEVSKELPAGRYHEMLIASPGGEFLLFSDDSALQMYHPANHSIEETLRGEFASNELAAVNLNNQLATANGSVLRIWDITSGRLLQVEDTFGWPITDLRYLPQSNILVVASLNARIRFLGTGSDGGAVGLQPMQPNVADIKNDIPAKPSELHSLIDLRTFPRIPNGKESVVSDFNVMYEADVSTDEATLFYQYFLGQAGWRAEYDAANPQVLRFRKDGSAITASFYNGAELKTMINVSLAGNVDLRSIPKIQSKKVTILFENEDVVMYRTSATIVEVETELLKLMHADGWTGYSQLHSAHNEREDQRMLTFLQGGMSLHVSVNPDPMDSGQWMVQYSRQLMPRSIPIPADAGFVEFDGSTQPYLVATTSLGLLEAAQFYDQAMQADSWQVSQVKRAIGEEMCVLSYFRGVQDVTVRLSTRDGKTLIRIGEDVDRASWQLTKALQSAPDGSDDAGIEAADFPLLGQSKQAQYDSVGKSLEFSMDTTPLKAVGETYKKAFSDLGWELDGAGIAEDDYLFLTFVKARAEVALRGRVASGSSIINIQGDGLLWNKPLPGGKKIVSYETWLRLNHHPATLDLIDRYISEVAEN
ncbi:MAG: hypothetical protein KDB22_04285 [Planctomycetales bacterium]|nr:hypothetical protein [Planctomycetales bacterium]